MSTEDKTKKLGNEPLAAKVPGGTEGKKITVVSSFHTLTLASNQPIHKYDVKIVYYYANAEGEEIAREMSKSTSKGARHTQDKNKCVAVFKIAAARSAAMRTASTFYDRQASLYSLKPLTMQGDVKLNITEKVSDSPTFVRAEFELKAVAQSFQATTNDLKRICNSRPALADRTLLEALNQIISTPAIENENVVTLGNNVHYLIDASHIRAFKEQCINGAYTAVGISKGAKCLEGEKKDGPTLYMNTETKTTMFHPNNRTLLELMKEKSDFKPDMQYNSTSGKLLAEKFSGVEFYCNYGTRCSKDEKMVVTVRGFAGGARDTKFMMGETSTTVEQYYKEKYGMRLDYPNLMMAVGRGKGGSKAFYPVELLLICDDQKITNAQMNNTDEKAALVLAGSMNPQTRKNTTEQVAREVGIASINIDNVVQVGGPQTVEALVRPPPKIVFNGGLGYFKPDAKVPTDYQKKGTFVEPKKLQNWEICYYDEGQQAGNFPALFVQTMKENGMAVSDPAITFLRNNNNLEAIFKNAKNNKRELIVFVFVDNVKLHKEIKSLEQRFDLLTQEIKLSNAKSVGQKRQTLLNIVIKTNTKLGGLNYTVSTGDQRLDERNSRALIVGFETSRAGGGVGPVCVGFAANQSNHTQKYSGGYFFVEPSGDIYGQVIEKALATIFANCKKAGRPAPAELIIYFNGVTDGQYALINESYVAKIKNACKTLSEGFRPLICVIASSKLHNERFYFEDGNIQPGTFINKTVVSGILSEFYLASSAARKGTTKAAKYTVVYWSKPDSDLTRMENLTNHLCYLHEIVFHPISLPAPLFIAGRCSQRGAANLSTNGILHNEMGEPDYQRMNQDYGYFDKKLGSTRFNA